MVDEPAARARLQRDAGQRVPDDVVHVAGDPDAVLRDGLASLDLAQRLELALRSCSVRRTSPISVASTAMISVVTTCTPAPGWPCSAISVEATTATANVTPAINAPRRSVRYAAEVVANTGPSPLAAIGIAAGWTPPGSRPR